VLIPLVFSKQLIGLLSVRIADNRQIDGADLEFVQSLAHQATLAFEMARLAEQAKQTALAIESEESRPSAPSWQKRTTPFLDVLIRLRPYQNWMSSSGK
jgi:transcriptional regulator with GAF, ATPase, and Fis domain